MSTENMPVVGTTEAAMLHAMAAILVRGTFDLEAVDALAAVETDAAVDPGARRFAQRSLRWLAQQSARKASPIWSPAADARH